MWKIPAHLGGALVSPKGLPADLGWLASIWTLFFFQRKILCISMRQGPRPYEPARTDRTSPHAFSPLCMTSRGDITYRLRCVSHSYLSASCSCLSFEMIKPYVTPLLEYDKIHFDTNC